MSTPERVLIAGGGLAGASAAFALRKRGFEGDVTIVSEEALPPYERPPLSKTYLRGETPLEQAFVRPLAQYAAQRIELLSGRRAVALDVESRRLTLDDGGALPYDALLLATGSDRRRLEVPGADLPGVHHLRRADDADAIRAAAAAGHAVAVVGGGWIGSEVAASLRQLGHKVTLITSSGRPLERVLGREVADIYGALHLEHGVRLVAGRVVEVEGTDRVTGLRLADGQRVPAEVVVVGIGAAPRIELARQAGLDLVEGGVRVDAYLRTSVPAVYAAGDIAAVWSPRYDRYLRIEHWDNAKRQGSAVAANIVGEGEAYTRTPYLYSDQFRLGMEYRGFASAWDRVVTRGDVAKREFVAFWLADGVVQAAMNANIWDSSKELGRLVSSGVAIDAARLADPSVPLADLVEVAEAA
jgi:3-phenylpropionate/trans-cinnamate dioxygenase ferredoxin reductase subunit